VEESSIPPTQISKTVKENALALIHNEIRDNIDKINKVIDREENREMAAKLRQQLNILIEEMGPPPAPKIQD
jgi:hypothetical protein